MKITVIGATGGSGRQVVTQALAAGHQVTALVRDPSRLAVPAHAGLEVLRADVADPAALVPALAGRDAVITALGAAGRGPTTVCGDAMAATVAAMGADHPGRLIAVSASGIFSDAGDGPLIRHLAKPILRRVLRHNFADLLRMEGLLRASTLAWTVLRPPRLTDGPLTGRYRTATDLNVRGGNTISRADLADCALRCVGDAATVRHAIGMGY